MKDKETARVTYGLVFGDQCRTARWIASILRRGGWTGEFRRCPICLDSPAQAAWLASACT